MRSPPNRLGAWPGFSVLLASLGIFLASGWLVSAAGQILPPDKGRERFRDPPLTLPETLRGDVRPTERAAEGGAVDTIRELFPALGACWTAPAGLSRLETIEITARFSLRRDGSLIGPPRITFATLDVETRARQVLTEATLEAIRRCTPLRLTKGFGDAVAGRPIAVRFIYNGPKGQGV